MEEGERSLVLIFQKPFEEPQGETQTHRLAIRKEGEQVRYLHPLSPQATAVSQVLQKDDGSGTIKDQGDVKLGKCVVCG